MALGDVIARLAVSLSLETAAFEKGATIAEKRLAQSQKKFEAMGKSMTSIGRKLSIGLTVPLTAFGVASFNAASDAAEMESAFDVSFGKMADSVRAWAKDTGKELGRSRYTLQESALAFNELFSKSFDPAKAAEMSKQFAVLTQDLGSFKNLSDEVAQQKLFSGLVGETEPLRSVGVIIDEAAVKAKGLALGLTGVNNEFTQQEKLVARAALIQEQLANAQGDVVRTADGTANQMRSASEAFKDLQIVVGTQLLPALTPLIEKITGLINAFSELSPTTQKTIVAVAALAAVAGPLLIVLGSLTTVMAPLIAGINAIGVSALSTGTATGALTVSLAGLRAGIGVLVTAMAPWLAILAPLGVGLALVALRVRQLETADESYRKVREEATKAADAGRKAAEALAAAHGKERDAALKAALAERKNLLEKVKAARVTVALAKAELARARTLRAAQDQSAKFSSGGSAGLAGSAFIRGTGDAAVTKAEANAFAVADTLNDLANSLNRVNAEINAALSPEAPPIPEMEETKDKDKSSRSRATGPSESEIESRFVSELEGYRQQILSARQRQATTAQESYDLEKASIDHARSRTLAEIAADEDYNDAQKKILSAAVNRLANEELRNAELEKLARWEQEELALADTRFENAREALRLEYDLSDTQADRKRIALDILALEQEYRRNQVEMVLASKTASEAEKDRAQAILDSLGAIEAGERASASRASETDAERYVRDLNKTPAQINEAIDGIKINGLEKLNDALTEAIVNFSSLGDAAKSVVKSILADLLRLSIQQSIIKPLAGALGLGIPGFANGTGFAPGGLALVGERGPELVQLPRGSRVFPNDETRGMLTGRGGNSFTWNVQTPDAGGFRRSQRQMENDARRKLGVA